MYLFCLGRELPAEKISVSVLFLFFFFSPQTLFFLVIVDCVLGVSPAVHQLIHRLLAGADFRSFAVFDIEVLQAEYVRAEELYLTEEQRSDSTSRRYNENDASRKKRESELSALFWGLFFGFRSGLVRDLVATLQTRRGGVWCVFQVVDLGVHGLIFSAATAVVIRLKQFRDRIADLTSRFFNSLLKKRGHSGKLDFDFEQGRLDLSVTMNQVHGSTAEVCVTGFFISLPLSPSPSLSRDPKSRKNLPLWTLFLFSLKRRTISLSQRLKPPRLRMPSSCPAESARGRRCASFWRLVRVCSPRSE